MTIEHVNAADPDIHEPKGVAAALAGYIYVANGAGSGTWGFPDPSPGTISQGVCDYSDLTTVGSPIALTTPGTFYELTNDGAGADTNTTYSLAGLEGIWNVATNRFDFSDGGVLSLGDTVDMRFTVSVTTGGVNTAITIELELDVGGTPYTIEIVPIQNFKTVGTYIMSRYTSVYMGNTGTLNNPARIIAKSDTAGATVTVVGWFVRALKTN